MDFPWIFSGNFLDILEISENKVSNDRKQLIVAIRDAKSLVLCLEGRVNKPIL